MATPVDREKDCPFLLRIFHRNGGHNLNNQYTVDSVPSEELSIYTWKNATLEEIAQLIEQIIPEARDPDARLAFRLVYLDSERARYSGRDIGRVVPANPTDDHTKTLEDCKFFIGDYLDVAIFIGPPNSIRSKFGNSNSKRSLGGPGRDRFGGRLVTGGGGPDRGGGGRRNFGGSAYNSNSRFGGGSNGGGGGRPSQRRGDRF
ncbi:Sin3 associated polypeptide p18-domain-containing protein [Parasitella parasitica]|nr:Sin3 associated polypeptide p18-domain-containing protein [Parasitella parasitica]